MYEATITVRGTHGSEICTETAFGNTQRTALAAGHALGRTLAMECSEQLDGTPVRYAVKVGAISEMREVAAMRER